MAEKAISLQLVLQPVVHIPLKGRGLGYGCVRLLNAPKHQSDLLEFLVHLVLLPSLLNYIL